MMSSLIKRLILILLLLSNPILQTGFTKTISNLYEAEIITFGRSYNYIFNDKGHIYQKEQFYDIKIGDSIEKRKTLEFIYNHYGPFTFNNIYGLYEIDPRREIGAKHASACLLKLSKRGSFLQAIRDRCFMLLSDLNASLDLDLIEKHIVPQFQKFLIDSPTAGSYEFEKDGVKLLAVFKDKEYVEKIHLMHNGNLLFSFNLNVTSATEAPFDIPFEKMTDQTKALIQDPLKYYNEELKKIEDKYASIAEGKHLGLKYSFEGDYPNVINLNESMIGSLSGIKVNDKIIKINNRDAKGIHHNDFSQIIRDNDIINFVILRDGKPINLVVDRKQYIEKPEYKERLLELKNQEISELDWIRHRLPNL